MLIALCISKRSKNILKIKNNVEGTGKPHNKMSYVTIINKL